MPNLPNLNKQNQIFLKRKCTKLYSCLRSYRKSRAAVRAHSEVNDAEASAERKRQISLCVQCGIVGLSFWLSDILFYTAPVVVPEYAVVVFFCSTGSWIFNNAMNPWLYLFFNKSLRHAAKQLLLGRKQGAVSPTTWATKTNRIPKAGG